MWTDRSFLLSEKQTETELKSLKYLRSMAIKIPSINAFYVI